MVANCSLSPTKISSLELPVSLFRRESVIDGGRERVCCYTFELQVYYISRVEFVNVAHCWQVFAQ